MASLYYIETPPSLPIIIAMYKTLLANYNVQAIFKFRLGWNLNASIVYSWTSSQPIAKKIDLPDTHRLGALNSDFTEKTGGW